MMKWLKHGSGGLRLGTQNFDFKTGEMRYEKARWRCQPFFKWFDLWVGAYVDPKERLLYVCYLPCCGFKIGWF